jgi:hypothetical protein
VASCFRHRRILHLRGRSHLLFIRKPSLLCQISQSQPIRLPVTVSELFPVVFRLLAFISNLLSLDLFLLRQFKSNSYISFILTKPYVFRLLAFISNLLSLDLFLPLRQFKSNTYISFILTKPYVSGSKIYFLFLCLSMLCESTYSLSVSQILFVWLITSVSFLVSYNHLDLFVTFLVDFVC